MLFTPEGRLAFTARRPVPTAFPEPGWVTQDAQDILATVIACGREALAWAAEQGHEVAAAGITNQRETTVVWERSTGTPVAPAIVWQSRQSVPQVERLVAAGHGPHIQAVTGLVPDAYFSATKVMWLFDHLPGLRERANRGELCFGTVDSWVIWHLLGGRHVTDRTNASRTMLMDLRLGGWSEEMLEICSIPRQMLPEIIDTWGTIGVTAPDLLGVPVSLGGCIGDQQSALLGQACLEPGQAKNTFGTGSFLLLNTGPTIPQSQHQLLSTVAMSHGGTTTYASEGAVFVTGSAVQWLRDGLGVIDSAAEIESLAGSVEDSGGVVFVPALTGLGAPHWDPDARGTILGLTRGSTSAHLARATLEGIAYQTRDIVEAMSADSGVALSELRVDGGAAANDLLMQIQADVLGVPVVRPVNTETTAWGAAALAGLSTGLITSPGHLSALWEEERRFLPRHDTSLHDKGYADWKRAVARTAGWADDAN